ncbi:MAG: T9SS type A sorting domain-containing protein [Ignavibacteriota bacterium]|nr:T9SS type A sorting domain-containing protein [Ignavibacteriales bacterium]MCZ7615127.1 T9SS type A sorting domain-containing protein [Ignavibacteriaceae bacterium]QKJ95935.1 MAG: T9SS type A sorting domain-containing protein [Ignavibacteriota bacterium]GJQ41252.1 MAG: hypothetical protein JETCAE03_07500 [Ignavibacteriaceae bacterium]
MDTSVYFDTIAYCKLYRELNYSGLQYYKYARLRIDSFYVLFNEFDSTETHIYYKKNAVIGDTWTIGGNTVYAIEDTFVANVFGEQTTIKLLTRDNGLVYIQEYWTEKFGKLSSQDFGGIIDDLQGCVIDGIVYGDTTFTIVSVEDESETPSSFYLAQNFPNPFNPSTTLSWELPFGNWQTLKIYDVLGNEIATLVDGFKPVGKYEVKFDASGLASGVYFYQLKVENYIETKKMQLVK